MRKPRDLGTMICKRCGKETHKNGAMQKYCPGCSEIADLERKNKWFRTHGANPDVVARSKSRSIAKQIERGKVNSEAPMSIAAPELEKPDFIQAVRLKFPFTYGYSKNAIYAMTSHGHLYLREQTNALRNEIVLRLRESGTSFHNAKVYLDIIVEKPDHRGDAVNVIDTICDAVKEGIGVDDRWFSIMRLDWRIVKDGGNLILGVYQAATEDERVCHRCGRVFPMSAFAGRKGKGRVCQDCRGTKEG